MEVDPELREQIRKAYDSAPVLNPLPLLGLLRGRSINRDLKNHRLQTAPDDQPVEVENPETPNTLTAGTIGEYDTLLQSTAYTLRMSGLWQEKERNLTCQHESEHMSAVEKTLGEVAVYALDLYKVRFWGNVYKAWVRIQNGTIATKLQLAAIAGHPQDPAPPDLLILRRLGYSSVPVLAERIALHNTANPDDYIPLPLSTQRKV